MMNQMTEARVKTRRKLVIESLGVCPSLGEDSKMLDGCMYYIGNFDGCMQIYDTEDVVRLRSRCNFYVLFIVSVNF